VKKACQESGVDQMFKKFSREVRGVIISMARKEEVVGNKESEGLWPVMGGLNRWGAETERAKNKKTSGLVVKGCFNSQQREKKIPVEEGRRKGQKELFG